MRNIKIVIEYEGTNYSGWQLQGRQCNKTIQKTLEKALSRILQEKIKVIGSGRTDAGVHARGQAANFKTKSKLSCSRIQKALNSILPADIRIKEVKNTQLDFHARFCALSKLYRYTIVNNGFVSPWLARYCYLVKAPLDINRMRWGARHLLGRHNFRSFQAADKKEHQAVRTIKRLKLRKDKKLIYLDIEADGFLKKMARNIAGTLIEVGRGRFQPGDIAKILKAKNRAAAGPSAPAKGLMLLEVKYK